MAHAQVCDAWPAVEPPRRPSQEKSKFIFREERLFLSHFCYSGHHLSWLRALYAAFLPYVHWPGHHHLWLCLFYGSRYFYSSAV